MYVLLSLVLVLASTMVAYPDTLHHPDNFCYVDRYTTPAHIVPEWYFLPFYSMLRACSSKEIGVILLGGAILVYAILGVSTQGASSSSNTTLGVHAVDIYTIALSIPSTLY